MQSAQSAKNILIRNFANDFWMLHYNFCGRFKGANNLYRKG